jgi:hypothetical protein
MAIVQTQTNAVAEISFANGSYADDAGSPAAFSVTVGFTPRYVKIVNQTTRDMYEWFEGMTAAHAVKTVAAGTRTAETSGGITVSGGVITLATAPAQNNQLRWVAQG